MLSNGFLVHQEGRKVMIDLAKNHRDAHRRLLGWIGLLLPALLVFLLIFRDGWARWDSLNSISAYYYTGAVAAFVGMLVSMSLFLFTYRGYEGKPYHRADRLVGIIAAVAALGVAVFPTGEPMGVLRLTWWQPWHGWAHYGCAVVLFAMFAVYALVLFRLTPTGPGGKMSLSIRGRDLVYMICGVLIVVSMLYAGYAGFFADGEIFWPESIALIAFAVSWLVKGKALAETAKAAVGRVKSAMKPRAAQTSVQEG